MLEMNRILLKVSIKKIRVFMIKMHTIIMILMSIEYYYTKVAINILLGIDIQMEQILCQLKIKTFYCEIPHDGMIYIENSDKGFFKTIKKIWKKIIKLVNINNVPNFIQTTIYDDGEYIKAKYSEIQILLKANVIKMNS